VSEAHVVEQLLAPQQTPLEMDQILATQFRSVVRGLNMTPEKWEALMDRHIEHHPMRHLMDPETCKGERLSFERLLMKPTMTWNVFCQALKFLNVSHAVLFTNVVTHDGLTACSAMNISWPK
jgi:hypothetical protein